MEPVEILEETYPDAVGGIVAGSVARGEDTASSDLDLLVLLPGRPAPMRRTDRVGGRLVECFVHTEESFVEFVDQETRVRRSPLLHMAAHGLVVLDRGGRVTRLRAVARDRWTTGPTPLVGDELEDRRYRLTALVDDLADETDPDAVAAVATAVFGDLADLALAVRGQWGGRGRWLARRLREADEALAHDLRTGLRVALDGDTGPLVRCACAELERAGGRLDAGYVRHA